jgi:hypothetical protein
MLARDCFSHEKKGDRDESAHKPNENLAELLGI